MSLFKGSYLRVLTPKTSDGNVPLTKNNQVQYKETQLPLSARKALERENAKRPNHLKHQIEVVEDFDAPAPSDDPKKSKKK